MSEIEHNFGGVWTEVKLEILGKYLNFYTEALKNKPSELSPFKLVYIDAMAGTGHRTETIPGAPLFDLGEKKVQYAGSAKIALNIKRKFSSYLFIENNPTRAAELEKLKRKCGKGLITIYKGDSNEVIERLAKRKEWKQGRRGVIFIDPYGMNLHWKSLEAIASTEALDAWYLFPTSAMVRQAAKNYKKIDEGKRMALNRLLGTREWENAFYDEPMQLELFNSHMSKYRSANIRQMEQWVSERLKKVFQYVTEPVVLPKKGPQLFSLYFCVSNPSKPAVALAKKVAKEIIRPHMQR